MELGLLLDKQMAVVSWLWPFLGGTCQVTLGLHCCNALYTGLPLKTVQKLQLVQNAMTRM